MSEVIELKNESSNYIVPSLVGMTSDLLEEKELQHELALRYGVKLGGYNLLIPDANESEVIINPKIFSIPNTSYYMLGMISIRGRFAPVLDVAKILDLTLQGHQKMMIVLNIDSHFIAFQYDSAHSLELPQQISENQPLLSEAMTPFVGGCYQVTDDYWYEFDFKKFVEQSARKI